MSYNTLMHALETTQNLTVDDVEEIVDREGSYVVKQVWEGKTTVFFALEKGKNTDKNRVEIAKFLIENGASMGTMCKSGSNPYIWSCKNYEKEFGRWLLENGFDINRTDRDDRSAYHYAAMYDRTEDLDFMLEKRVNLAAYESVFLEAVNNNSLNAVKWFVKHGFKPKMKHLVAAKEKNNNSVANYLSTLDSVKSGASSVNEDGTTPLHAAVQNNQISTCRAAVDAGCNVNAQNSISQTPLHLAVIEGNTEIVKFLISKKANANIADNQGNTPLHLAYTDKTIADLLIKAGADPSRQNNKGESYTKLRNEYVKKIKKEEKEQQERLEREKEEEENAKLIRKCCIGGIIVGCITLFCLLVWGFVALISPTVIVPPSLCGATITLSKNNKTFLNIYYLGKRYYKQCSPDGNCELLRADVRDDDDDPLVVRYGNNTCRVGYYNYTFESDYKHYLGELFPEEEKCYAVIGNSSDCKGCRICCLSSQYTRDFCDFSFVVFDDKNRIVRYRDVENLTVSYGPEPALSEFALDYVNCSSTFKAPVDNPCSLSSTITVNAFLILLLLYTIMEK